jgi:endonuclease YncB( thermonuclease family)
MPVYRRPETPTKPANLVPEGLGGEELTPSTRVVCINRGDTDYLDKCDGRDYVCAPGLFEVEYQVADHFRTRSVIPGSRDPISGKQEHYIAILGIDPPEQCQPLSGGELDAAKAAPEALDRSGMSGPDKDVKVVPTQAARARTAGGARRPQHEVSAPDAVEKPVGGEAMQTIQQDKAGAAAAREEE